MKTFASFSDIAPGGKNRDWTVWPDSCWLLSRRPLYIPPFPGGIRLFPCLALKTGRLGKSIAPKFAHRYFAEYAPALLLVPVEALSLLDRGLTPPAPLLCFDNAIVLGDWAPLPESADCGPNEVRASSLPHSKFYIHHSNLNAPLLAQADLSRPLDLIVQVSAANTVKTGDIFLLPLSNPAFPLEININDHIEMDCASSIADPNRRAPLSTNFK